jgi:phosphonate transport system permease protein
VAFFYGLLPQNGAELTSYTVYRWRAIRLGVLGFVGGRPGANKWTPP